MYKLIYGFWSYLTEKRNYYILILGLDRAGKTTYLEQTRMKFDRCYKKQNLNKITSTVGCNIGSIDMKEVRLNFWDLGGEEELQSLWDQYYAECDGIIYLVDSSDNERLEQSWQTFDNLLSSHHIDGKAVCIACNKQDIENCMTVGDIRKVFNKSDEKIGVRDFIITACSALTGDGIGEGIDFIHNCVSRMKVRDKVDE